MAIDPTVQQMTPKQRERWAWGFVVFFAVLLVLWGAYHYGYRPRQLHEQPVQEPSAGKDAARVHAVDGRTRT